jgi:hypothetical protein
MTTEEINQKWAMLQPDSHKSYRSVRISADCIPEMYLGTDLNNVRSLILKLPPGHAMTLNTVIRQNLSLEMSPDTNWVILKLSNIQYNDLFNDLIISLYNKVKLLHAPGEYTGILLDAFYRWSDFFEDNHSDVLSSKAVMGLAGELHYLAWEIQHSDPIRINEILEAWQGPFEHGNDFVFNGRNVEVKTKMTDALDVRISSEFQLQPEPGRQLRLTVVSVERSAEGLSIAGQAVAIRQLTVERLGDFSIFLRALRQLGLTMSDIGQYDHLRFRFTAMNSYDCTDVRFPKINTDTKPALISSVKYNIRISNLDEFIIERHH